MPSRVLAVLATVLIALLGFTACGGSDDTKSDFNQDLASINTGLKMLGTEVGTTFQNASSQSGTQLAAAFSGYATQLQTLQTTLDDTSPPDNLKADVDVLSEAMAQAAKDMIAIARAATGGDTKQAKAATVAFLADSKTLRDARLKLVKATGVEAAAKS